jgi:catechol 2,3-dioxygenase-like lactoylglutathione lyase family enzyme
MTVRLNHTILAARDRDASANFLTTVLGLAPAVVLGPFAGGASRRYLAGLHGCQGPPRGGRRDRLAALCLSRE